MISFTFQLFDFMARLKVHLLNFHGIFSHSEVVVEDISSDFGGFYRINRWSEPYNHWGSAIAKQCIEEADAIVSFEIEADPAEITQKWRNYWYKTEENASILGNNCAVASQWFLTEFAGIPKPNLSNISWNHLALGIMWPSFIPCPVMLSGRVMSNTKFYVNAGKNKAQNEQLSRAFIYSCMAAAALVFTASLFMLVASTTLLSGLLAPLAIAGCAIAGSSSAYGFFHAYNKLSETRPEAISAVVA